MDETTSEDRANEERDEQLARVLDDLTARAKSGEMVDIHAEADKLGPDGDELRELWAAVMLVDAVGSEPTATQLSGSTVSAEMGLTFELPYRYGDYELIEELGRGGMGVVYRAQQLSLGRDVAIKMLLRGKFASEADQTRFRAEAEAAARIDHSNIVPVYDVGSYQGYDYFSMKLIIGQTLAQRLAAGPLPARQIATIMLQVARAISIAHDAGILHRDLKPSNIMLDEQGHAHVTDFGLAKKVSEAGSLTKTGAVLGTPTYMAPEQAAGNRGEVGVQSDVYSLGCILYHMLAGQPPFTAKSPVDVVLMVLEEDPPLPRSINPKVDRSLEMITLRCMQKPVDLRYATANQLANDLEAYLHDEPISAQSGRMTQMVSRFFRETHNATILENWGLLWMWHSLVLIVICFSTNALHRSGYREEYLAYFLLWTAGLGAWAAVFWALRSRMGPVTFVERQIAHLWAASMISIAMLFPIEYIMGFDALTLSPMLALSSGMVFLAKASILSGSFYFPAFALFFCAIPMAYWSDYAHMIFGVVSAACFFFPGLKYYRQKSRHLVD